MKLEMIGALQVYDRKTKKHRAQDWKLSAGVVWKDDTSAYYASFIKKRYNLELVHPLRGTHITIVNDKYRDSSNAEVRRLIDELEGEQIRFEIDTDVRTDGNHWWMKVTSPEAHMIRHMLGFDPNPYFPFHLTIGYAKENEKDQAKYIQRQILRYEADLS